MSSWCLDKKVEKRLKNSQDSKGKMHEASNLGVREGATRKLDGIPTSNTFSNLEIPQEEAPHKESFYHKAMVLVGMGSIMNEALFTLLEDEQITDQISKEVEEEMMAPPLATLEEVYSREREIVSPTQGVDMPSQKGSLEALEEVSNTQYSILDSQVLKLNDSITLIPMSPSYLASQPIEGKFWGVMRIWILRRRKKSQRATTHIRKERVRSLRAWWGKSIQVDPLEGPFDIEKQRFSIAKGAQVTLFKQKGEGMTLKQGKK